MYQPEYRYAKHADGQHTFMINHSPGNSYEYAIFAAWSEGEVYNTREDFEKYVQKTAIELNNPVEKRFVKLEEKN